MGTAAEAGLNGNTTARSPRIMRMVAAPSRLGAGRGFGFGAIGRQRYPSHNDILGSVRQPGWLGELRGFAAPPHDGCANSWTAAGVVPKRGFAHSGARQRLAQSAQWAHCRGYVRSVPPRVMHDSCRVPVGRPTSSRLALANAPFARGRHRCNRIDLRVCCVLRRRLGRLAALDDLDQASLHTSAPCPFFRYLRSLRVVG